MYTSVREQLPGSRTTRRNGLFPRLAPNVVFLGITSLLTDISSEMVSSILPLYFVLGLGFTPLQFGLIDGLYHGVTAVVRLAGGIVADRWRRHKEVAALGYGVSAICKLGLLAVGGMWAGLLAVIVVDRAGKGIRTAPRDALISLSTPREELGTAFGVHRAMDTVGALLGPVLAFGILVMIPGGFDVIFVASFAAALLGVSVLVLFVKNRPVRAHAEPERPASVRRAFGLLGDRRYRSVVLAVGALSVATISDAFVYLALQSRLGLDTGLFPLLFVATAVIYFALAVPIGRLADRIGRVPVLIGGYVVLLAVYGLLLLPSATPAALVLSLLLFGAYYAATDGVATALASSVLPEGLRSSGLALLSTGVAVGRLLASVVFGLAWAVLGMQGAVVAFACALIGAIFLAVALLSRVESHAAPAPAG